MTGFFDLLVFAITLPWLSTNINCAVHDVRAICRERCRARRVRKTRAGYLVVTGVPVTRRGR